MNVRFRPLLHLPLAFESRDREGMLLISKVKALEMGQFKVARRPEFSQEYPWR